MKRKTILLIFVILAVLTLTACSRENRTTRKGSPETAAQPTVEQNVQETAQPETSTGSKEDLAAPLEQELTDMQSTLEALDTEIFIPEDTVSITELDKELDQLDQMINDIQSFETGK